MVINLSDLYVISNNLSISAIRAIAFKYQLLTAAKNGNDILENEVNRINNLEFARREANVISIRDIFADNWNDYKNICTSQNRFIRESITTEVEKMIDCKNLKKGYLFYECPNCNNFHIQGLSCHSRFCASCGKKYRDARAAEVSQKCLKVPHRHITWTISDKLRPYFRKHHKLYDELFAAVNDSLKYLIQSKSKAAKRRKETLGFISTIHTFGRDMGFNPHIHTLVAECTIDKDGNQKPFSYFNYEQLRKSFMKQLLDRIQSFLFAKGNKTEIDHFIKLKIHLYKTYGKGFYVNAPQVNLKGKAIKQMVEYVTRYAGHPAISESRITEYNKETKTVSYYYDPHEDDAIIDENDKIGRQYITESVYKFITKLIIHIPESKVHTTRYYGFYANHSSIDISNKVKLFSPLEIYKMKNDNKWRNKLLLTYKYDPILCHCGTQMTLNKELSFLPTKNTEDG